MANFTRVGSEFLVNSHTYMDQSEQDVAGLAGGGFVAAWVDSGGPSSSPYSVRGQVYAPDGHTIGSELAINTLNPVYRSFPATAKLSDGSFVVTWFGAGVPAIEAQRFTASGAKIGPEFFVGEVVPAGDSTSVVTALDTGGFVVTWVTGAPDGDIVLKAQVFDGAAAKVGEAFLIDDADGLQIAPTITGLPGGAFVVSWMEFTDLFSATVHAQLFDPAGNKISAEFESVAKQSNPSIAALENGGYVIAWSGDAAAVGDGSFGGISAQLFDASGATRGSAFLVNTQIVDTQGSPSVAALTGGGFVVAWTDESNGFNSDIKAQVFDSVGAKVDGEFRVNSQAAKYQNFPSVAGLENGGFVVSWGDTSGTLGDSSGSSIKAQIYAPANAGINHSPALTGIQAVLAHGSEDIVYNVSAADLLKGYSDPDGDILKIALLTASNGAVTDNHDGTFTISSDPDFNGPMKLSYTVTDLRGGTLATSLGLVLDPANDAPTAADQQVSTAVGQSLAISAATLLQGSSDVDGDALSIGAFQDRSVHGAISLGGGGELVYTPEPGFSGYDSFFYTVDDGHGGQAEASVLVQVESGGTLYDFSLSPTGQVLNLRNDPRDHMITGSQARDILIGGGGNDVIAGGDNSSDGTGDNAGHGNDVLTGGSGADTFVFYQDLGAVGQDRRDVVTDFTVGEDKIALNRSFGGAVKIVDHFTGSGGELREDVYSPGWVMLTFDTDGDTRGDYQINVHTGGALLTATDFMLI